MPSQCPWVVSGERPIKWFDRAFHLLQTLSSVKTFSHYRGCGQFLLTWSSPTPQQLPPSVGGGWCLPFAERPERRRLDHTLFHDPVAARSQGIPFLAGLVEHVTLCETCENASFNEGACLHAVTYLQTRQASSSLLQPSSRPRSQLDFKI